MPAVGIWLGHQSLVWLCRVTRLFGRRVGDLSCAVSCFCFGVGEAEDHAPESPLNQVRNSQEIYVTR